MRRSNRSWQQSLAFALVAALFLALSGGYAAAAPTDLLTSGIITDRTTAPDPIPEPSSTVTPYQPLIWINDLGTFDLHPGLTLSANAIVDGFIYSVDRSPATNIAMPGTPPPFVAFAPTAFPGATSVSLYWPTLTPTNPGLDMRGWLAHQTVPYSEPGMNDPVEGRWYLHARTVVDSATGGPQLGQPLHGLFAVDVTPPSPVRNLRFTDNDTVKSYAGYPLLGRSRVDVFWDNPLNSGSSYDSLSGDSRWRVTLNSVLVPDIGILRSYPYGSVSIENLRPVRSGINTIGVNVIDRAGNMSDPIVLKVYSDGDPPAVSITRPVAGAPAGGAAYTFSAAATDLAGLTSVTFKLDGRTVYTDTSYPYSVAKSMAGYAHGSYHTLAVTANDLYGHTTTVNRTFRVDKVRPRLTMYGDSPDPFYPVLQDGYKDKSTIKFRVYERCTVTLRVFKSNGSLWRQSKSTKSAGLRSMTWDGKGKGDAVQTGTFYYRIGATDVAGNTTWSSKRPTHIRNYELKQTADGGIQVIPR